MLDYELMKINGDFFSTVKLDFYEEDMDMQQKYFKILNKVVDAIVMLKYEDRRIALFEFNSVNEINDFLIHHFDQITEENKLKILEEVIDHFNSLDRNIATTAIINIYKIYLENNRTLPQEHTLKIYNYILNEQQNEYFSTEKEQLTRTLKKYFPLSEKKEKSLSFAAKREEIIRKMQQEKYEEVGLSVEKIRKMLDDMHAKLDKQKPFNKLSKRDKEVCDQLFLKGQLEEERLKEFCPLINKKYIKKILAKYNKILLEYAETLDINYEINTDLVEFNYNHLKIMSQKKYDKAFEKFYKSLSKEEKKHILEHKSEIKDLLKLLPFTNIPILEYYFNVKLLKSLILNYDIIKKHLAQKSPKKINIDFNYILNHLKDAISLAKVYCQTDEIATSILDENIIEKIIQNNRRTSCNPYDYIEIYKKMLEKGHTEIPPISFYYRVKGNVYKIESGNNYDKERLLIGKNCYTSCLSPEGAGEKAYTECLTKPSGDVILIRNALTNEFRARCLVFRRGNTLVLANILDNKAINKKFYDLNFLYTLGNMFLQSAQKIGDNLEYVVINKPEFYENSNYLTNKELQSTIPHCDVEENFILIGATKKERKIDIKKSTLVGYYPPRQVPIKKRQDYIEDIKRIRALQITYFKESTELRKNFNRIGSNYRAVYVGQDFYIALDENYNIESVRLPINDKRQEQEINICMNDIINIEMNANRNTFQNKNIFAKK